MQTIVFTGHRVDDPDRPEPRFPAEKEPLAAAAIRRALEQELATDASVVTIAGGASGGDILFHEACTELGIASTLWLAVPPERYVIESVAPAGATWIDRFWRVYSRARTIKIVQPTDPVPRWLRDRRDWSVWQLSDLSMLEEAIRRGVEHATIMALWNGQQSGVAGEIAEFITIGRDEGARVLILDSGEIFGLDTTQ